MIVVLEGPEGTGKTTLSEALCARWDFVSYRTMAWKGGRLRPDEIARWRELGVPVNTYVDDVYAADLLASLDHQVALAWEFRLILDRSMPSGVAYTPEGPAYHRRLIEWWVETLQPLDARLIHLDAPVDNLMARLPRGDTRRHPEHLSRVRSTLGEAVAYAANLPTLCVDVSQDPFWDGERHNGPAVEDHVIKWLGL